VAKKERMLFTDFRAQFPEIPKASLARILNELVENRYLRKSSDGYACGDRLGIFASLRTPNLGQDLIERWQSTLAEITRDLEITTLLLERVGDVLMCIDRHTTVPTVKLGNHRCPELFSNESTTPDTDEPTPTLKNPLSL
jgi:DNA-binding IclR family transcriptional regulator